MFIFKYGSMPIDKATKSTRLVADEVMPALHADQDHWEQVGR